MKEAHRTVILVILLLFAIGFLIWLRQTTETSFSDTL
jgi:hypothetical protein